MPSSAYNFLAVLALVRFLEFLDSWIPRFLDMDADHAGKITGMLLEMSEADVIRIFEDRQACEEKVSLSFQ